MFLLFIQNILGAKSAVKMADVVYAPSQQKTLSSLYGCKFDRQGHLINQCRIPRNDVASQPKYLDLRVQIPIPQHRFTFSDEQVQYYTNSGCIFDLDNHLVEICPLLKFDLINELRNSDDDE